MIFLDFLRAFSRNAVTLWGWTKVILTGNVWKLNIHRKGNKVATDFFVHCIFIFYFIFIFLLFCFTGKWGIRPGKLIMEWIIIIKKSKTKTKQHQQQRNKKHMEKEIQTKRLKSCLFVFVLVLFCFRCECFQ